MSDNYRQNLSYSILFQKGLGWRYELMHKIGDNYYPWIVVMEQYKTQQDAEQAAKDHIAYIQGREKP